MTEIAVFDRSSLLTLTADIVTAHVSNNSVSLGDLPSLIASVHGALAGLGDTRSEPASTPKPAVPVRLSVKPDYLVCLEDGRKFKTLKRHLMNGFGLTPDEYRAKWNLPADYPMVAPSYAATRSALAKSIGLGRKPGVDGVSPASRVKAPAEDDLRWAPKPAKPPAPRGSRKTLHLTVSDKS